MKARIPQLWHPLWWIEQCLATILVYECAAWLTLNQAPWQDLGVLWIVYFTICMLLSVHHSPAS